MWCWALSATLLFLLLRVLLIAICDRAFGRTVVLGRVFSDCEGGGSWKMMVGLASVGWLLLWCSSNGGCCTDGGSWKIILELW